MSQTPSAQSPSAQTPSVPTPTPQTPAPQTPAPQPSSGHSPRSRALLPALALLVAAALLFALTRPPTPADPPASGAGMPLRVQGAQVVAVPPSLPDTSVYARLENTGAEDLSLTAVESEVAAHGMLMITTRSPQAEGTQTPGGEMLGMRMVESLTVPAGGVLELTNTGAHLMLMGLKRPLEPGQGVPVTVIDRAGRRLTFTATVTRP